MTDAPVVQLAQGAVRGVWRLDSAAFLGIPFAEAPVGELRYAAPVPAGGWEGVRECTEYGPTAQVRPLAEVTAIPEPSIPGDAVLNVNVFTPGRADAALPVLVWIHGGGYKGGSPASPWYDGFAFNRDGIVTVTISYRLGFDGFGWIPDAPHNRGLLDQIAALEWVRDNIAAFGGDPANVTIGGQSAGGGSVWALLLSPRARGLFHAAISHSGALRPQPAEVAEAHGRALADLAGVEWSRAGLAGLSNTELLELTERLEAGPPPTSLADAVAGIVEGRALGLAFTPYVDGEVLEAGVEEAVRAGVGADVPLLMGATAHEFTEMGEEFSPLLATGTVTDALRSTALAPVAEDYVRAHADLPGGDAAVVGQLVTDTLFRIPMVRWAGLRADAPHLAVRLPLGPRRDRARLPLRGTAVRVGQPGWRTRPALVRAGRPAGVGRGDAWRVGGVRPLAPGAVAGVVGGRGGDGVRRRARRPTRLRTRAEARAGARVARGALGWHRDRTRNPGPRRARRRHHRLGPLRRRRAGGPLGPPRP